MENSIFQRFIKYVGLNILGMLGLSCYILADTFFIAKALGANGIAALNFSISIYSVIHATGLMLGMGGATRYSILKAQNKDMAANRGFTNCIKLVLSIGMIFLTIGIFSSEFLAKILGADENILPMTKTYLMTIMCFSPAFLMNNTLLAYVRNDHNPKLPMIAMLTGSFSNIILDYVFMFPLGMGMFGAAIATCLAPIISLFILSLHFVKKKNGFRYIKSKFRLYYAKDIFRLGASSFITEISSAVVLITFNLVIIGLRGNIGVGAYGIVANIALVVISVFVGIAQGVQPILSQAHGLKDNTILKKGLKLSLISSLMLALIIYISAFIRAYGVVSAFNRDKNLEIANIATSGIKLYFIGFFFAGVNIILAAYFSAKERAKEAMIISIARGCVIIVPLVLIFSRLWEMTGVWLAYVFAELIVTLMAIMKLLPRHKGRTGIKSN